MEATLPELSAEGERSVAAPPVATGAAATGLPDTDISNAERLVKRHGDKIRFCGPYRSWYVYNGKRWRKDDAGGIMQLAKETAFSIIAEAHAEPDEFRRGKLLKHAASSANAKRLWAMVSLAQCEVPILPTDLDVDAMLLNVPNGTIDLKTGELRGHVRGDMLSKLCPTLYDPGAICPRWEKFLASIFAGNQGMIRYVQNLLGYCLTGDVREDALFVFFGSGANGKTALLNVVRGVMGSDYSMTPLPTLLLSDSRSRHPTEVADLYGKRLTVLAETQDGGRLDEAQAKRLTGRDRICARKSFKDAFEFDPTHKLILATNYKPDVKGFDDGIWRRLHLIPFGVQFWNPDDPGAESRPDHLRQDKEISKNLLAEEASGILAWIVRGCLDWQRNGLGKPREVAEATASYRAESDVVCSFVDNQCDKGESLRVEYAVFVKALGEFAKEQGLAAPAGQSLWQSLSRWGCERKRSGGIKITGLALKPNAAA